MKTARYHTYGGPEAIQIDELPLPEPGPNEVQIKVAGYGVNPFDWKLMSGVYKDHFPVTLPAVLGSDISGTVTKLGEGVTDFAVGDEIFGVAKLGASAEYTVAAVGSIAKRPTSLDLPDAAAVPVAAMTAWQALFDHGGVTAGQRVLIHAGAGGVGNFAIQLAKWKGAYVITTATKANEHFVRELGADEVIDYTTTPFETAVSDIDMVLDSLGGESQAKSISVLKKGGIIVSLLVPPDQAVLEAEGKRGLVFSMTPHQEQLQEIGRLIEDLQLKLVIAVELPFDRIKEAIAESQTHHVRGKIVVRVS